MIKTSKRIEEMSESLRRLQLENKRLTEASTSVSPISSLPAVSPSLEGDIGTSTADKVVIESLRVEVARLTNELSSASSSTSMGYTEDPQSLKNEDNEIQGFDKDNCENDNDLYVSPSQSPSSHQPVEVISMENDETRATSPSLLVCFLCFVYYHR